MRSRFLLVLAILGSSAVLGYFNAIAFAQTPPSAPSTTATTPAIKAPAPSAPKRTGSFQPPKAQTQRPGWGSRRAGTGVARPGAVAIPPKPGTVAPLPTTTPAVPAPAAPKAEEPKPEATSPTTPEVPTEPKPEDEPKTDVPGESKDAPTTPKLPAAAKATGKAAIFHEQYKTFFLENEFTPEFIGYWQTTLAAEPERLAEIVQESAAFAAEAVAAGVAQSPMAVASVSNGLGWLEQLYFGVDETGWRDVGAAIAAAFNEAPAPFATLLDIGGDPTETRTAMQTCMTLALFGDQLALKQWIALPARCTAFLGEGQAFLFGGGALAEEQFASLVSLFKSVPREVHQVLAVIVPEGAGMEAADAALSTPGMVLNIYAGATGFTAPDEFFSELGTQPVAPVFTVEAAVQLVRAAQYVQFSLRPELQQRRDLILRNAGGEPTRYLRRALPPGAYLSNPDELLPQTAYLWCIDSTAAFQQAGGLLRFNENEPMDALLLLADVLSGGGDATLAFRTGLDGIVGSAAAAIQRAEAFPGVAFATGITVGGQYWSFGIDQTGGVTRETAPVAVDLPTESDVAPF